MTETNVERKLTTVLSADVAGYTRLMDADEVTTLARLSDYRDAFTGFVTRHRGTVVNTAGDSVLAEFPSVVEAVQCALEVQRELGARNDDLPDDQRMDFRIGVNLGDVMVKNGDLFGEGVNIANRLQQIAAPGGICISGPVYDQVHNKISIGIHFLGLKTVKNIAEEVPVYRLETGVERAIAVEPAEKVGTERRADHSAPDTAAVDDRVRKEVARLKKFYRHLSWYAVINGAMFILNMVTSPGYWWWLWVAFGTGIPLAFHALRAYDVAGMVLGHDWEERKTREVQERMKRES
jgi:adenylate cyclase